jgi:hypothetical protein
MATSGMHLIYQRDKIIWRWTSNGKFTVSSAYECQFHGSMTFPAPVIWKASSDTKSNFFTWLIVHGQVLTVENMAKRNWQCIPTCSLCLCMKETTEHLLTKCNYTEAAWNIVAHKFNPPGYDLLRNEGGPLQWVQYLLWSGTTEQKKQKLGILFTFWWQVWKERNKWIFLIKKSPQLTICLP